MKKQPQTFLIGEKSRTRKVYWRTYLCLLILFALATACTACGGQAESGQQDEGEDPFIGSWVSADENGEALELTLDIWMDSDGVYHGEISIPQDETTVDYLEFSAKRKGKILKYTDGKRTRISYEEENLAEEEIITSKAAGEIRRDGDRLIWKGKGEKQRVTFS